ncbi:hypothetical protein C5C18_11515 [Rathayibacter tritici]|nr:hypothetical protein C5C06_06085 [Rathayibacter tritici]PPF65285.1 hypothetical protein C5C21_10940 [Rathayibacter tritici]PPG06041.1 hypothetical protein C5C18_11515 [Rathayibacter tritici]PPI19912.1 hypothetical protein C5D07_00810 [Rathayibacter tritici]
MPGAARQGPARRAVTGPRRTAEQRNERPVSARRRPRPRASPRRTARCRPPRPARAGRARRRGTPG